MRLLHLAGLLLVPVAIAQAPAVVSPQAAATQIGTGSNWYPFGTGQIAYQQVHSASSFSSTTPRTVQALRLKPRRFNTTAVIDVELHMGHATGDSMNVDRTFANNVATGSEVNVVTRKSISLPSVSNVDWHLILPFDNPFSWNGGDLEWRAIVHGNNNANQPTHYSADYWTEGGGSRQTGSFAGCASALGSQAAAQVARVSSPGFDSTFRGESFVSTGGLPAAMNIGLSSTSVGGLSLPLDLTPFGAAGCEITNDIRASVLGTTQANLSGSVEVQLRLPHDARLAGAVIYTQFAFLQPGANAMGVFLSPGSTNTIGQNHGITRVFAAYGAVRGTVDLQAGLGIGFD